MDAFTAVAQALGAGLSLWLSKEKTKYRDRLIDLERKRYEEKNRAKPDHAVLDNLDYELFVLCRDFSAAVAGSQTPNQP